jgi:hypothetical protein
MLRFWSRLRPRGRPGSQNRSSLSVLDVGAFAIFLVLSLASCATRPVSIHQASAVPPSRVLTQPWLSQGQHKGSLIVKRDSGFMGSACTIRVFVDGVAIADLAPSEKVEVFVAFGEHVVGAAANGILCGGGVSEAAVTVRPESGKILRIASGQSGDIYLQPTAF